MAMRTNHRPQAIPIYALKPSTARPGLLPISWWWRSLGELLGGCVLVVAAVYLWWGVGPR